jgi:MazG family protein
MNDKLSKFVNTIAKLRSPDGCPWDKEQDHNSLKRYLLEEAYEVLEAIDSNDPNQLKEELGDLLLQVVLHAQIAKDNGEFDIQNIAEAIDNKMINRHPHVFGDSKVNSAKDVVTQWEKLKEEEAAAANQHNKSTRSASIVDRVPKTFPALLKALKVSEAAVSVGFEWSNEEEVWQQIYSELNELKDSIEKKHTKEEIELEIGDVLFSLVNLARWHKLNPEDCLSATISKFQKRFASMEDHAQKQLSELSKSEWAGLWQKAKTIEGE